MDMKIDETVKYNIEKQNKREIIFKEIIKKKIKDFSNHLTKFNKTLKRYQTVMNKRNIDYIFIQNIIFNNNKFKKINLPHNDLRNLYFIDPHMTNLIQIAGYKIIMDNLWRKNNI